MLPPQLPTTHELRPWLDKLSQHPGSVVLIALESFNTRNDCRVTVAWLSAEERKVLKEGLLKARAKREKDARKT